MLARTIFERIELIVHGDLLATVFPITDTYLYPGCAGPRTIWGFTLYLFNGSGKPDLWDTHGPFETRAEALDAARRIVVEEWEKSERLAEEDPELQEDKVIPHPEAC
jgi:hypothetical protein